MFIFNVSTYCITVLPHLTSLTGIESVVLNTCACFSAAKQLVSRGFFPCTPIIPTLAIDIEMLQFLSELFIHIPSNNTAWTETLESIWAQRQYKLTMRVCPFAIPVMYTIHPLFYRICFVRGLRICTAGSLHLLMQCKHMSMILLSGPVELSSRIVHCTQVNISVVIAPCVLEQPTFMTPIQCK